MTSLLSNASPFCSIWFARTGYPRGVFRSLGEGVGLCKSVQCRGMRGVCARGVVCGSGMDQLMQLSWMMSRLEGKGEEYDGADGESWKDYTRSSEGQPGVLVVFVHSSCWDCATAGTVQLSRRFAASSRKQLIIMKHTSTTATVNRYLGPLYCYLVTVTHT